MADRIDTETHLCSALVWLCSTRTMRFLPLFHTLSALDSHPHSCTRPPFSPPFSSFGDTTTWMPPRRVNPLPSSFFLPPLKLAQGAHHGRRSPHLVTRQCFSSTPPPLPCCLGAADLATFTPHPCNQQSAQQAACKLKPRAPPVATHPRSFSHTLVLSSQRHAAVSSAPPPTTPLVMSPPLARCCRCCPPQT